MCVWVWMREQLLMQCTDTDGLSFFRLNPAAAQHLPDLVVGSRLLARGHHHKRMIALLYKGQENLSAVPLPPSPAST